MPDVRIEDLGRIDELQDGDFLVVGSGNDTYKVTVQSLKEAIRPPVAYKRISTPGIYKASEDGVYGYSSVSVAVDSVTGVKGDAELNFRRNYVNIAPADLGLVIATVEETKEFLGIRS